MVLDVIHPEQANVSNARLTELLAKKFKCDDRNIVMYGFKTAFGGGRSSGFVLIYDSMNYRLKYEPKYRLRRAKILPEKQAQRKPNKELKRKIKKYCN